MGGNEIRLTNVKNPIGERAAVYGAKVAAVIVAVVLIAGGIILWSPWSLPVQTSSASSTVGSSQLK
jgi:cytochrome b subunit of formate dehydrogenase